MWVGGKGAMFQKHVTDFDCKFVHNDGQHIRYLGYENEYEDMTERARVIAAGRAYTQQPICPCGCGRRPVPMAAILNLFRVTDNTLLSDLIQCLGTDTEEYALIGLKNSDESWSMPQEVMDKFFFLVDRVSEVYCDKVRRMAEAHIHSLGLNLDGSEHVEQVDCDNVVMFPTQRNAAMDEPLFAENLDESDKIELSVHHLTLEKGGKPEK